MRRSLPVFVAYTLEYVQAGGLCARRMAMCVFAGMMACLLRNNMIYAMLVWVALLLVFGRGVRRAACWALLAAVLGMGANQALAALTHADSGDAKEMLSVPAQQLSRRVHACSGNLHGRRNGCHGYILWQRGLHAL